MMVLWALFIVAESTAANVSPAPARAAAAPTLAGDEAALLAAWFKKVGPKREGESFGDLVVRAASLQIGRAYYDAPQTAGPEVLRIELKTLQCVSLVESSLAVARCVWRDDPGTACFLKEVEASRYRGGAMAGYDSRLHYFTDWIEDNARRGRLKLLGAEVGAISVSQTFSFMSEHPAQYPALGEASIMGEIKRLEAQLSAEPHLVLDRADLATAQSRLENGDVIGLVSDKYPGMVIIHTGLVYVGKNGKRQLLHAAAWHKRVLITASDIANYINRRPERLGLMVARPLPP
jgi:hypothetical protein